MIDKVTDFIDDHFFDTAIAAKLYSIMTARLPLYYFIIIIYILWLLERWNKRRKRDKVTDLASPDSAATPQLSNPPKKANPHRSLTMSNNNKPTSLHNNSGVR